MDQIKIGKYIATKRREHQLTQEELASILGVTDRAVSNWENGKNMPDLSLFKPLCNELEISINDLMSGEDVNKENYVSSFEENMVNMVSSIEHKNNKKIKVSILISLAFIIIIFIGYCFYNLYEIDVKYDKNVISCEFKDNELVFSIKGQSLFNTRHISKMIDDEEVYFFHSTINLYNKRESNYEYSHSMSRLLENKSVIFGYHESIDIDNNKIKVYYTDKNLNTIEKSSDTEIKKIIDTSYLLCSK